MLAMTTNFLIQNCNGSIFYEIVEFSEDCNGENKGKNQDRFEVENEKEKLHAQNNINISSIFTGSFNTFQVLCAYTSVCLSIDSPPPDLS